MVCATHCPVPSRGLLARPAVGLSVPLRGQGLRLVRGSCIHPQGRLAQLRHLSAHPAPTARARPHTPRSRTEEAASTTPTADTSA
eukprot:7027213-Prymnesium_polylepis.2